MLVWNLKENVCQGKALKVANTERLFHARFHETMPTKAQRSDEKKRNVEQVYFARMIHKDDDLQEVSEDTPLSQ